MKIKTPLAFLLFVTMFSLPLLFLPGCKKEHLPDETIYFQEDMFPLLVSNCTQSGCHNSVDREQGYDLTTYEGILKIVNPGDPKGSKLYKSLVKPLGFMPYRGDRFTDDQITAIALWIDQGALENSSGGSNCDTTGVTYNATVQPILDAWCYSCHAGSNPTGVIRLDSYVTVKAKVDEGLLLGTIRHDPTFRAMPDGGGKIPNCDIKKIEKWVAEGALNN